MKIKKYMAGMLILSGALLLGACGKRTDEPEKSTWEWRVIMKVMYLSGN